MRPFKQLPFLLCMDSIHGPEKKKEFLKRVRVPPNGRKISTKQGKMVWLDAWNLKTYRPSKKLDQKKLGPFRILEKIRQGSYRLQLPKSWNRVHPVFNEASCSPIIHYSIHHN